MSDAVRPHRLQPTRLSRPWDSPGKNTGVGCHFLLQCTKVKRESEVAQSCLTLCNPMDCSPPGSSVRGTLQARVLEWGAIAFSTNMLGSMKMKGKKKSLHLKICQLKYRRAFSCVPLFVTPWTVARHHMGVIQGKVLKISHYLGKAYQCLQFTLKHIRKVRWMNGYVYEWTDMW